FPYTTLFRSRVVLPDPERPSIASDCPELTEKSISCRMVSGRSSSTTCLPSPSTRSAIPVCGVVVIRSDSTMVSYDCISCIHPEVTVSGFHFSVFADSVHHVVDFHQCSGRPGLRHATNRCQHQYGSPND